MHYLMLSMIEQIYLMQRIEQSDLAQYEILRLESNSIIMRNLNSRKIYNYSEQPLYISQRNNNCYQNLPKQICKPLKTNSGYLFQLGMMDLSQQLETLEKQNIKGQHRIDNVCDENPQIFWESEIYTNSCEISSKGNQWNDAEKQYEEQTRNTIISIYKIIQNLHRRDIVHGSVSAKSIFADQYGQIKMYYPGLAKWRKEYYSQNITNQNLKQQQLVLKQKDNDIKALGILALKMLGLYSEKISQKPKQYLKILLHKKLIHTNTFIILKILLQTHQNLYKILPSLLDCPTNYKNYPQLQIFQQKTHKKVKNIQKVKTQCNQLTLNNRYHAHQQFTPPLIKHDIDQLSPRKTLQITKKLLKIQDCQNKKVSLKGKEEQFGKRKKNNNDTALKKMSNGKISGTEIINHPNNIVLMGENYYSPKDIKPCTLGLNNHVGTSPTPKKLKQAKQMLKQKGDTDKIGTIIRQRMRTIPKKKINQNC